MDIMRIVICQRQVAKTRYASDEREAAGQD